MPPLPNCRQVVIATEPDHPDNGIFAPCPCFIEVLLWCSKCPQLQTLMTYSSKVPTCAPRKFIESIPPGYIELTSTQLRLPNNFNTLHLRVTERPPDHSDDASFWTLCSPWVQKLHFSAYEQAGHTLMRAESLRFLGQLTSLRSLSIDSRRISNWGDVNGKLSSWAPQLECLEYQGCPALDAFPSAFPSAFPWLTHLIARMPPGHDKIQTIEPAWLTVRTKLQAICEALRGDKFPRLQHLNVYRPYCWVRPGVEDCFDHIVEEVGLRGACTWSSVELEIKQGWVQPGGRY